MKARLFLLLSPLLVALAGSPLEAQAGAERETPRLERAPGRLRNPARVTAVLELARVGDRQPPKVRFEWPTVPRATAYLLIGSLTDRLTWAVRSTELRITRENALEWTADRIQYEATLAPGLYSWKLVAVYPANEGYDLSTPALVSFEVR